MMIALFTINYTNMENCKCLFSNDSLLNKNQLCNLKQRQYKKCTNNNLVAPGVSQNINISNSERIIYYTMNKCSN